MPYSVDSDLNKENPRSPSEHLTLNEQLMYKIAALDASVQSGFRRLDEKMDRFQSDLHDSQIATNDRINNLDREFREAISFRRARIDKLITEGDIKEKDIRQKINELERWRDILMAKVALIITALGMIWIFLAPTIRGIFGIPGG